MGVLVSIDHSWWEQIITLPWFAGFLAQDATTAGHTLIKFALLE
jgi:hypothetical protein